MGMSTEFSEGFKISKPLDLNTYKLLENLANTRRMKRNVDAKYGIDGEFYVQGDNEGVINNNQPPSTQPGLWCQWTPNEDGTKLEWDGNEKFYNYVEWINYISESILKPRGYSLSGEVEYSNIDSRGYIIINEDGIAIDSPISVSETKKEIETKTEFDRLKGVEAKYNSLVSLIKESEIKRLYSIDPAAKGLSLEEYTSYVKGL